MTFSNRIMGLGRMSLLLSAGIALTAQESGALNGIVKSDAGKPISGATVVISAPQLIAPRTVVTAADGTFRVPLLPAGDFTVTVSAQGFVGAKVTGIRVGLGAKMSQDISLKPIKAAETTVEVIAAEATVDKTDTKTATNFSQEQLTSLPAADRAFFGAVDLAPGVQTTSTGSVTVRGGMTQSTIYTLNGVSIGDDYQGQQYNNRVLDDAVEDVQVVQSPLNARFGRTSGGLVNVQSKSGGNEFAGSVRTQITRSTWGAWRPYERENSARIDDTSQKEYDIVFSGPVFKDKLWFAVQSIQQPSVTSTDTLLQGENPSTWGAGYALNPGDLSTYFGLPSEHYYSWDLGKTLGVGSTTDSIDVKLTYALTADHTFTYEYYRRKDVTTNRNPYGIPIVATVGSNSLAQNDLYKTNAFSYRGVLSSNVFVEANYSILRSDTVFPSPALDHVRMYSGNTQYGVIFPYGFNIAPSPDARDNQSGDVNVKVFGDWHGSHEIDMGLQFYEFDRGTQTANGPNNSRYFVNYATGDPAELNYSANLTGNPNAAPFTTWRPWNPGLDPYGNSVGFLAATQADEAAWFGGNYAPTGIAPYYQKYYGSDGQSKNRTTSIYVNDQWSLDNHWGIMGGLRLDRLKVYDTDGTILMAYNTPVSPRFQVRYDINGDSSRLITFTAAKFFDDFRGGYTDAFIKKANSTYARWGWTGANMGWAPGTIGFVNYAQLTNPANYMSQAPYVTFSSAYNNMGMGSVTAPYTLEYTLGYRRNYTDGSYVSMNLVHRDWKNQFSVQQDLASSYLVTIPDFTGNGLPAKTGFGTVYGNSDILTRRYNALELEFLNKISPIWAFAGSLTVSRLTGNTNGGDSSSQGFRDNSANLNLYYWMQNQGPVQAFTTPYTVSQIMPDGVLGSDQAFKGRLSLTARVPVGKGYMSYSWLLRYDSGTPYSAVENNRTNAAAFATYAGVSSSLFPSSVPVYYSGRGAFRFNDTYQVDFKLAYEVPLGVGKTRLVGDMKVSNLFNHQQQGLWNTGFSSTSLAQGTPITVSQPGVFGTDMQSYSYYIAARTVAASLGLRF